LVLFVTFITTGNSWSEVENSNVRFEDQQSGHLRIFDHLNSVENTNVAQIAGERNIGPHFLRRAIAGQSKIGTARTTYSFQTGSDRDPGIEQLCLLQTVVSQVELLTADIEADQGKALASRLVEISLFDAYVTHLFPQRDGSRTPIKRFTKQCECPLRRAVFNEQIGVQEDRFQRDLGKRNA
jgi:hypothetical protein